MNQTIRTDPLFWKDQQVINFSLSRCCLCFEGFSKSGEYLVCSQCNIRIHKECYGQYQHKTIHTNDIFLCDRCEYVRQNNLTMKDVQCVFCPNIFGLLKRFHYRIMPSKVMWCHVLCACLIPQIVVEKQHKKIKDNSTMEIVILTGIQAYQKRSQIKCNICNKEIGFALNCQHSKANYKCEYCFHVTCGLNEGFIFYNRAIQKLFKTNSSNSSIFCTFHLIQKTLHSKKNLQSLKCKGQDVKYFNEFLKFLKKEDDRLKTFTPTKQLNSSYLLNESKIKNMKTRRCLSQSENRLISRQQSKALTPSRQFRFKSKRLNDKNQAQLEKAKLNSKKGEQTNKKNEKAKQTLADIQVQIQKESQIQVSKQKFKQKNKKNRSVSATPKSHSKSQIATNSIGKYCTKGKKSSMQQQVYQSEYNIKQEKVDWKEIGKNSSHQYKNFQDGDQIIFHTCLSYNSHNLYDKSASNRIIKIQSMQEQIVAKQMIRKKQDNVEFCNNNDQLGVSQKKKNGFKIQKNTVYYTYIVPRFIKPSDNIEIQNMSDIPTIRILQPIESPSGIDFYFDDWFGNTPV